MHVDASYFPFPFDSHARWSARKVIRVSTSDKSATLISMLMFLHTRLPIRRKTIIFIPRLTVFKRPSATLYPRISDHEVNHSKDLANQACGLFCRWKLTLIGSMPSVFAECKIPASSKLRTESTISDSNCDHIEREK